MDVKKSKKRSRKSKVHDMADVKEKPRKRSLVERELETTLTEHLTSPSSYGDGTSKSRYGRARRLKTDSDFCTLDKVTMTVLKSPKLETCPSKSPATSPAYKMHASNSQMQPESPKRALENNLENQIENIYNANISLSRFGSDEKKPQSQSPAKKFPKVYTRKDLIQSKGKQKEVTVTLIRNIFSPTQSGQKQTNSHLSNILERSSEKYNLSIKPKNGYLDKLSVVKTLDFDTGATTKKEELTTKKLTKTDNREIKRTFTKSEIFDLEAKCDYQVGDIAWARMGTFPFWPCIVTREPDSNMFVKKKMFGKIEREVIHVTFFGDNGRRSWILDSMLRKFQGLAEFETARGQITPETKRKDPKFYAAFMISAKKLPLWHTSIEEAEMIQREPKRLRIDYLNELLWRLKSKVPTPPKEPKSLKITRTDSDVSLSESLFDTLFSEDDGKNDTPQKLRNKSLDVSDVVTACLDNMAAKTGITKIQRQSHMDIWLQKAKSHTPEKGQLNVAITVERVEKDDAKSKKTVNKDSSSSSFRKKKIVPREVPTQKPYSFRKSTESRHLLSYHNEHDYSKHIDSEISDKSYLTRQAEQSKNALLVTDNPICVIDKIESLSVGAENQLVNIATEVQEDLITEIVQDQVVTSNKENDKEIKIVQSDKTIEGTNQKHKEMKTDSLKKTDHFTEKEITPVIDEISQPSLVSENKSVTDKMIETEVDKITRLKEVSNNDISMILVNLDFSQADVISESVKEKSGNCANLKENSDNNISNTSSHSKTKEETILTSVKEQNLIRIDSPENNSNTDLSMISLSSDYSQDSSKVTSESNTLPKNNHDAGVTFEIKDQQSHANPVDLNISFDDDKTSCNSPENVQDENEDIYNVVSAIDNLLNKVNDNNVDDDNLDNDEEIIDNNEPKKDENSVEVNCEATSIKVIDVCTDNNIVLSSELNKKSINESFDDFKKDKECQEKASDTTFLESTMNENEEQISKNLLVCCLPTYTQSEETVCDDVGNEIKGGIEKEVISDEPGSDVCQNLGEETKLVPGNMDTAIISVEKNGTDENKNGPDDSISERGQIELVTGTVTKNLLAEMVPIKENEGLDSSFSETGQNVINKPESKIKMKINLVTKQVVLMQPEERNRNENAFEAIYSEISPSKHKKKKHKAIKSPLMPNNIKSEGEDLHPTSVIQMESENKKTVKGLIVKISPKKHKNKKHVKETEKDQIVYQTELVTTNLVRKNILIEPAETNKNENTFENIVSEISQNNQKKQRRESKAEPSTNKKEFIKDSVSNGVILIESDDSNGHETALNKVLDNTVNKAITIKSTGDLVSQKGLKAMEKDKSSNISKHISEQTCNTLYEVPVEYNSDKLIDRDVLSEFSLGDSVSLSSELTNGYTNSSDKDFDPDAVSISSLTSEISSTTELLPRITRISSLSKKLNSDILQKAPDTSSKDSMFNVISHNSKPVQNKNKVISKDENVNDDNLQAHMRKIKGMLLLESDDEESVSSVDDITLSELRRISMHEKTQNLRHSTENTMDSVKSDVSDKKLRLVLTDCLLVPTETKLPEIKEVSSKTDVEIEIVNSATSPETSVPKKRSLCLRKSQSPSEPKVNGFHESKMPSPELKQNDTSSNEEEEVKIIKEPELDSISIISSDSNASVEINKATKTNSEQKPMSEPEFLEYLELRQDGLMDDHPELPYEEIVAYLYKTWQYKENLKSNVEKDDEEEYSNTFKDVTQNEIPKKDKVSKPKHDIDKNKVLCKRTDENKVLCKKTSPKRKLINIEKVISKEKSPKKNHTNLEDIKPRELPKRKVSRAFYKEELSDLEDEIELFEIFKPKNNVSVTKVKPKQDVDFVKNVEVKLECETAQIEPKIEVPPVEPKKEEILNDIKEDLEEDLDDLCNEEELYFEQLTIPKPNVFKGLAREKVCEICERPSSLVKCKRCNGMFHIDCEKKETKVVEVSVPTRGRKKKKKPRGRKPKSSVDSNDESHSDEKSPNATISEENTSIEEVKEIEPIVIPDVDSFETQMEAKMKEIIEKINVEYDSYSSDDGIDWTETVAGKCEIVDIKLKPRSLPKLTDLSDFKCKSCQENETPICFVCKSSLSPKGKVDKRQKCQVAHCHKYYHIECLEHWPQTQFTSGEPSRNNKKIDEFFEPLTCPRHVCHTCVCDDPRGCKTRFSGDKLARCVRCPATYHSFTKCLPAGSQILSASHIVCPRHYQHPPGKVPYHVNTGWCFICALGGKLICCDYCPTSFHADCLNMTPPEGGYMCEDCETGRLPLYGEMVWVKLGHYRWWPGIILHPSEIPANIQAVKHSPGEFVVRFFGQYDHYWVNRGRVFPFQEGDKGRPSGQKSKLDEAFLKAMEHALRAFEILKNVEPNDEENQDIQSSLMPPHYVKLKVNKPCGSLYGKKVDIEESSLTQCECNPDEEEPCGPYSHCLNRMLLTECGPTCRAGERCQNRAFEKRLYPKLVPYRTAHRGWGLKTLEDIKAGQFVIEYVGELIDEMEFQRRMRRQHETRDENYYYLTLDKERMIDAGPKGNLARFMNHCCEPNCETQKWTVLGDVRVGLFAIHDIPANTEVTFNYNLECTGIEKKQCMCGAKRCSGYIGAKPKQDEPQPKKPKIYVKRTYKKRKTTESPSTSGTKPKRPVGRPAKPRELTDIEKDLLIIKNATSGLNSDSEGSGRLSSVDGERKDAKTLKRKRVSFSADEVILNNDCSSPSVKRLKLDDKSSEFGD